MRVLVTAFEPFGDEGVNASLEALRRLPAGIAALELATAVLPVSYARALAPLELAIEQQQPDIVLCLGQAADRVTLCLERVAINVQDARIADNDDARPLDAPIVTAGPAAYFANLPLRPMLAAVQNAGIAAEISNSAGTFVCNHVFYGLMHFAAHARPSFRGGFLHVPALRESSATVAMTIDDMVCGIVIALEAAGKHIATEGRLQ